MTRVQFLNDLYRRLPGLTREQAEQHLTYYAEMLADRMEEGMSEEEAVASMEPVEVIAQRILQDEGIDPAAAPPQYPDLPQTGGSRFTKVPDLPRKKNWKKIGNIALWAVAIVMAFSAVKRWQAQHFGVHSYATTDYAVALETPPIEDSQSPAIDRGYYEEYMDDWDIDFDSLCDLDSVYISPEGIFGDYFSISPEGIWASDGEHELYIGPEGFNIGSSPAGMEDEMVGARYSFADDTYRLDPGEASGINIDWTSGIVKVRGWEEDYIQFQEFSNTRLKQSQKLEHSVDGVILNISNHSSMDKGLIVWVPAGMLDYLAVDATAADIYWDQVKAGHGEAYTTSGDIALSNAVFHDLEVQAYSGNATLRSVTAVTLEHQTTSGDTSLGGVTAEEMNISSSSGNVSGFLAGNSARIDTTSGKITVNTGVTDELVLSSSSGKVSAALQDGATGRVDVETASGNVVLRIPYHWGFELEFDSSSGYFDHGPFSAVRRGDKYIAEGYPAIDIEVDTSSGNLQLEADN